MRGWIVRVILDSGLRFWMCVCVWLVCCLTLGFDILIVVLLSPRWIWAIPAPVSPLMPAPPDQHCKCHLFKCKCCILCFLPGTSVHWEWDSHSHSLECPHLWFYIEDRTAWSPHKHTWPNSQQLCWRIIKKRIRSKKADVTEAMRVR